MTNGGKPTINLPAIPKPPRTPMAAAFYLDLFGEIVFFAVMRSWLVIIFFVVSSVVVFAFWYFERLLKRR